MLFKIAWRNIWRRRTRSLVIMASVLFGIWAGLFIQGYMNGMVEERVRTAIQKEISHIQIHHPGFNENDDLKFMLQNGKEILTGLSAYKHIKAFTGRIITRGMIAASGGSAGIKLNGVEPLSEDSVTQISKKIIEGNYFSSAQKNEIIIGEKLLKKLNLKLNSKVVLTLMDKDNNITSGAFRIRGIFKTQNTPYDESNVFIKADAVAELTNTNGAINEIAILLFTNDSLNAVMGLVKSEFPDNKIESWKQIAPEMNLIISTANQSMLIYMGIIMLALAFGIINTMLMAVLERTREIGMLMALGMNKFKVFMMILIETILLVFTGAPIGVLLGYMTIAFFNVHGIDMSDYKDVYASFGYSEIIYPSVNARDYLVMLELVVVTSLISALFPARKALSLKPSEAIRK